MWKKITGINSEDDKRNRNEKIKNKTRGKGDVCELEKTKNSNKKYKMATMVVTKVEKEDVLSSPMQCVIEYLNLCIFCTSFRYAILPSFDKTDN